MSAEEKHIILVACAAGKRDVPQSACDLYESQLFAASRAYAEARSARWYILSALHGVIEPDQVIAPYERTLNEMPIAERREGARSVNEKLSLLLPPGSLVEVLAGKKYRESIVPFLRATGFTVHEPLARLRVGEQVQWLKRQVVVTSQPTSNVTE